jgi:iron complex outermembrane receptor protein
MNKQFLLVTSAFGALAFAGAALAADAPVAADDASQGATVGELVVTAEKREQNLQDVPVAISAYTSAKRDLVGINSVQDMTNFTPGLQYSSQLDRISLRGVGRLSNVHSADAGVATYSDGVYTTSTVEAGKTPLFVDRVEVLRGPQGTLYGRNAIAGAINVISRHPTKDWYAELRGSYSNYNHSLIEGAVSGPLADNVQFRIAGNWERQTKGYYKNIGGAPDEGNIINTLYVEGQLAIQFNDRFEGWAKLGISEWHNGGGGPGSRATWTPASYSLFESGAAALTENGGYAYGPFASNVQTSCPARNPQLDNPRVICTDTASTVKLNDTVLFASQWTYHADKFDVRYITGGTHYHYTLTGDLDNTGVTRYTTAYGVTYFPRYVSNYQEREHWWSHEINILSTDKGPLQWLAGGYYYKEGYLQPVWTALPDEPRIATPLNPITFGLAPANPLRRVYDDRPDFNIRSAAAFGQVDWQATETLKFTAGLRYSNDHKWGLESVRVLCLSATTCAPGFALDLTVLPTVVSQPPAGSPLPRGVSSYTSIDPATGFATRHYDASWSALTGTAGVDWTPDRDTLVFAKYSRGYKSGGFRVGIDTTLGPSPFTDKELVNSYEIGLKRDFGRTLQTNIDVFYYDYQNAQVPLSVPALSATTAVAQAILYNVPKAESKGVEVEGTWAPIDNLQLTLSYSYLDAHIKRGTAIDPADPAALDAAAAPIGACTAATCPPDAFTTAVPGGGFQRLQNLAGGSLPNSPKNKVALNVNYTWRMDAGSLTPSVSYIWRDAQYGSIFNRSYYRSPSWSQVDARLTWKSANNKYTVIGYAKNLFDTLGYDGGATAVRQAGGNFLGANVFGVQGIATTYPITPPRTYGVELQYRFF